jgi:DNA-binding FrmR family transcriptional regulator
LDAVEKALKEDAECSRVLLTLAACRGSLDALMCEIMEGHVRFHVLNPKRNPTPEQKRATEDVIAVIRRYLK